MDIKLKETDSTTGEIVSVTKDASGVDVETPIGFYVNEAQKYQLPKRLEALGPKPETPEWLLNGTMYAHHYKFDENGLFSNSILPSTAGPISLESVREQIIGLSQFSSERKEILTKERGDRDILGDYPETPACLNNAERSTGLSIIYRLQNIKANK